jgi:hypothetical protein
MAIMHDDSPLLPRVEVLLESVSPYGSRLVTVEFDGEATAAYLRTQSPDDGDSVIAATWIANHRAAPTVTDTERLSAGLAPLMPASSTSRPRGRSRPDPATLEAIWFEEGDGVAITERGALLAVLPGWASSSRGMPGYSRDIVGQTPFGWSLDDAIEGLAPRVQRARAFWQWRESAGGWGRFQQAALAHLESRLGPAGHYWDASMGARPAVGISERPMGAYTVLATVGMSCQRMPVVEQVLDDPRDYARVELALAVSPSTVSAAQAARIFPWLATYPWRSVTWFGPGHTVRWYADPANFPLGPGYQAVLLLDDPSPLASPPSAGFSSSDGFSSSVGFSSAGAPVPGSVASPVPGPPVLSHLGAPVPSDSGSPAPPIDIPDLSGFAVGEDPVRWLWIVPISERIRVLAKERGSVSAVTRLATEGHSWICGSPG